MEREISSGAMLGIVLLALAAVIGLGFGVFAITKGVANEGTVSMQDSLTTVSDQAFLDYDQKIVTGTQATAALKTFEGKPYAILIGTRALQDTDGQNKIHVDHKEKSDPSVQVFSVDGVKYVNYNALIDPATPPAKKNGSFVIDKLLATDGDIEYDLITVGIFKPGNSEYVSTSSKFNANVIKDSAGNYIGLVFEELSK